VIGDSGAESEVWNHAAVYREAEVTRRPSYRGRDSRAKCGGGRSIRSLNAVTCEGVCQPSLRGALARTQSRIPSRGSLDAPLRSHGGGAGASPPQRLHRSPRAPSVSAPGGAILLVDLISDDSDLGHGRDLAPRRARCMRDRGRPSCRTNEARLPSGAPHGPRPPKNERSSAAGRWRSSGKHSAPPAISISSRDPSDA